MKINIGIKLLFLCFICISNTQAQGVKKEDKHFSWYISGELQYQPIFNVLYQGLLDENTSVMDYEPYHFKPYVSHGIHVVGRIAFGMGEFNLEKGHKNWFGIAMGYAAYLNHQLYASKEYVVMEMGFDNWSAWYQYTFIDYGKSELIKSFRFGFFYEYGWKHRVCFGTNIVTGRYKQSSLKYMYSVPEDSLAEYDWFPYHKNPKQFSYFEWNMELGYKLILPELKGMVFSAGCGFSLKPNSKNHPKTPGGVKVNAYFAIGYEFKQSIKKKNKGFKSLK